MTPEERDLSELQNPDAWDWESAELHPVNPRPVLVVSVEFSGEEFDHVGLAAEHAGLRTPDFIRQTVLSAVRAQTHKR